jgi:DNA-binding NtrC family response regulator
VNKSQVLIIDDEDLFREDLATMLRRAGYTCHTAEDAAQGIQLSKEYHPEIILSDIVLPDRLGTEIIGELRAASPGVAIIMLTAYGDLESALEAFRMGSVDYLLKPVSKDELMNKIGRIDEQMRLSQEVSRLRKIVYEDAQSKSFVGKSPSVSAVRDFIRRVATVDSPILITGESGTGKEVVAREVHKHGNRSKDPFLAINCGAIPDQLLESELFGHVKGAFTGATESKMGFFELAGEGTLLLDEIGDMPLSLQTKLLRALEEKEFFKVGSTRPIPLRARIISSTNRDLSKLIVEKAFRDDLFYRINVVEIHVPPLRSRKEDISLLVEFFLKKLCNELGRPEVQLNDRALSACMNYDWPGNVRQLRNVLERALILGSDTDLNLTDLPPEIRGKEEAVKYDSFEKENLKDATKRFERQFIQTVIDKCGGNRDKAAERMGVNPSTLYRKLKELDQET